MARSGLFGGATAGVLVVAAMVMLTVLAAAPPAFAHGPCGCLQPRLAQAGATVRIGTDAGVGEPGGRSYPAYRVIFNPRPSDLGIAPRPLAGAYRADVATTTVLSHPRRRPTRRGSFRVPAATPAGLYMVLIFDGGEGGAHNTWEYLHVIDPGRSSDGVVATSRRAAPADSSPGWWAVLAGAALVSCAVCAAAAWRRGRRRR